MKTPGYFARLFIWLLLGMFFGYLIGKHIKLAYGRNIDLTKSPTINVLPTPTITITPTLAPKQQEIEDDIKQVFGKYSDRALLLLQSPVCHENRELDPKAVNDNTAWGGVGKDYGVFQINDHWQGVTNTAFLFDPAINVRMAYRIFADDGYSFKLWTCGRELNI